MSKPKLLEQLRNAIRVRQYSIATEWVYLQLVRRFILFHGKRHPATMNKKVIEAFLSFLAVDRGVAPSTQNVSLAAVLFLYRNVLEIDLPWLNDVIRAKLKRRVPVVLSTDEVSSLLPASLARKVGKSSHRFNWQFVFPALSVSADPRDPRHMYRHHIHRYEDFQPAKMVGNYMTEKNKNIKKFS